MLEEALSMLGEGPAYKEGSLPLGEDLAEEEELQILEGSPHYAHFSTFVGLGGGSGSMPGK